MISSSVDIPLCSEKFVIQRTFHGFILLILCVIIIAEMICSDTGVIWENSVKLINFRWEFIFLKNL